MTEQIVSLLPVLLIGFLIGAIFFSTLFWTIKKGLNSNTPSVWFLGGFVVRISFALCAFYLLGTNSWQQLIISLLGFLLGRLVIHKVVNSQKINEEVQHAP